jgi:hypothetical protein
MQYDVADRKCTRGHMEMERFRLVMRTAGAVDFAPGWLMLMAFRGQRDHLPSTCRSSEQLCVHHATRAARVIFCNGLCT